ncbi:hypothetical protein K445DRAFT_319732 [Daldinia sp. EC12]|nr:hypothetical protein K445DRAFT_319732 [Daldinia sp. EC12]
MPNLHTFASQPMHPRRLLTIPSAAYPITAQILRSGHDTPGFQVTQMNHALLHHGLSRSRHIRFTGHRFTRFYYADGDELSAIPNMEFGCFPLLFNHLTHLDMCIGHVLYPPYLEPLGGFIAGSKELTHLRLCCERTYLSDVNYDSISEILLGQSDFYLPRLRFLHLSQIHISAELLILTVKKHTKSLQSLRIEANVPSEVLRSFMKLVEEDMLRLEELTIIPDEEESYQPLVFTTSA